jgi:histidinol dehydrogenase
MQVFIHPKPITWPKLIQRPKLKQADLSSLVHTIFSAVEKKGDVAVKKYSRLFDQSALRTMRVSAKQLSEAEKTIPLDLQASIRIAARNIEKFHRSQIEQKQIVETMPGVTCWRENRAIGKVGIYIPAGSAPLFSTVLMLAIPAKIAGCAEIVLCTPPNAHGKIDPVILYTAHLLGLSQVFAVGGIQAIAAMTFGTKTIAKVDKIFGPGNQYVTAAKQAAQNYGVAIDMPAGPSEVLIIATKKSNPVFVAADLLAQAEHGADSQVILLSDSEAFVWQTAEALKKQMQNLPRKAIVAKALKNSRALVFDSLETCMQFSNAYAPEHLILATDSFKKYIPLIENAGSVFLGRYACESAGDYASGTNHTLPTNGYARNYSGVSLDSFVKKITFQNISADGLRAIGPIVEVMAEAELLEAHKNAVTVRLEKLNAPLKKKN